MPRLLCLDIEGGYGGSSRSLYESVRHLSGQFEIEVWCRKSGPAQGWYQEIGVPVRVVPSMPHVSSLPRISRNFVVFGLFLKEWLASRTFRRELLSEIESNYDLVHFNHEGLFALASWLRKRTRQPFTMHVRTNLWPSPFARWQCRTVARSIDHLIFITENEEATFRRHGGVPQASDVIFNIVSEIDSGVAPYPGVAQDKSFRIACISNLSYLRGLDRLVDVAVELRARGRSDVKFVMAGNMSLSRGMPGELGSFAQQGKSLRDYASSRGVAGYFNFLGHVNRPEQVLAACHALIKPTREQNPWGRDILEALAAGRPVFTVGKYDRFVETGKTGLLQSEFDAAELATCIVRLAEDRKYCETLGGQGKNRVMRYCDGKDRAADLARIWRFLIDKPFQENP